MYCMSDYFFNVQSCKLHPANDERGSIRCSILISMIVNFSSADHRHTNNDHDDDDDDDSSEESSSSSSRGATHCSRPERPENGWVKYRYTSVGARAWYYCRQGYTRNGAESRTCKPNGKWEPELPTCERKDLISSGTPLFRTTIGRLKVAWLREVSSLQGKLWYPLSSYVHAM